MGRAFRVGEIEITLESRSVGARLRALLGRVGASGNRASTRGVAVRKAFEQRRGGADLDRCAAAELSCWPRRGGASNITSRLSALRAGEPRDVGGRPGGAEARRHVV